MGVADSGSFDIAPTSDISWKNHKAILTLPKGRHTLGMSCTEASQAKINWLRINGLQKD